MHTDPPSRIWPYLIFNAFVAVWLDFSRIHQMLNSDSIIFSLSSLYEWRPFFWEQDRVGMLWPLLFVWCRHPLGTLLLQTGTTIYLGLCLPVLFARVITPHRTGPAIATLASTIVMVCAAVDERGQSVILDNWLVVCNFPGALTLALGAVLVLERRGNNWWSKIGRIVLAWGMLLAAHWVYLGVLLFMVPFVVFRGWLPSPTPTATWWRVAFRPFCNPSVLLYLIGTLISAAAVYGFMLHVLATDPSVSATPIRQLPTERWPWVWGSLVGTLFQEAGVSTAAIIFGVSAILGIGWGVWRDRRAVRGLALQTLPALLAASGEFTFLGTRFWVENNSYHPRYLVAIGTAVCLSILLIGVAPVFARWRVGRLLGVSAGALLLVACTIRFGWPGPDVPRQAVDWACWEYGEEVAGVDPDIVSGEYFQAWPVVYHTNLVRYERGEPEVWGLSYRCGPWRHRWDGNGRAFRVAMFDSDNPEMLAERLKTADYWGGRYGLRRVGDDPVMRTKRVVVYEFRYDGK